MNARGWRKGKQKLSTKTNFLLQSLRKKHILDIWISIPLFLFSILLLLPSTHALTVFIGSYYNIQGWNYDDVPRYFD